MTWLSQADYCSTCLLDTYQTSSELKIVGFLCAGPLSSPGFAGVDVPALMQAIPPEPPLLGLVALLLKMTQVTHQVLALLLAGALGLLKAPTD